MTDIAAAAQSHLVELDATFEVIEIDPDLADTAQFCEAYGYRPEESANAILVASKRPAGLFALCVVLATTRLDVNKRVRHLLDVKKLSFAPAETTMEQTGMMIGGVTPFGAPSGIPLYVDSRVMELPRVIVGGGDRATKLLIDPEVFTRLDHCEIIEDLAIPIVESPA